jgi:hypothetical protein
VSAPGSASGAPGREPGDTNMRATYVRVVVIWVVVLAALFAFQQYFSH